MDVRAVIEIFAAVFSKLFDLLMTRATPNRSQRGLRLLYEIYLSLYEIVRISNNLLCVINGFLHKGDELWPDVSIALRELTDEVKHLSGLFDVAQRVLEIFDRQTADEIDYYLGLKHMRLLGLISLLREGEEYGEYPSVESRHLRDTMPALRSADPVDWDKIKELLSAEPIYLTEDDRQELKREYERGLDTLAGLESLLKRYATFLRADITLEDLLAAVAPDGKRRQRRF